MNAKSRCDTCELKGYSPELCRLHFRNMAKIRHDSSSAHGNVECAHYRPSTIAHYGKTAAVGAGVGLIAACGSMAVIPSVALKALFGHVAAVKMSAGAGGSVAGAGINIFRKTKKETGKSLETDNRKKNSKKRRHLYFPLNVTGGNLNG
ncbi:MAG: hypothetical protein HQK61_07235 [Desulfamplus sp.]|nr:hypothetical protein [Desulfamplus sp.]